MNGISTVNIELTSRCNKDCWMCGRRKYEADGIDLDPGDMDYRTLMNILPHLEPGMLVQLHWNGEPTLFHILGDVARAVRRRGCIVSMNTNALLLGDRWHECTDLHSVACSIIQNDKAENWERQSEQTLRFLEESESKGSTTIVVLRLLGRINPMYYEAITDRKWSHRVKVATRVLHAPEMSRSYQRRPTMPEAGICLDMLHHIAIDRYGYVYPCVRFNPYGINKLGNVNETPLDRIVNGEKRRFMIDQHAMGLRNSVQLCSACHYWGCPTGI